MKEAGVYVRYRKKYKVTTHSNYKLPVFDNVLKGGFNIDKPDRVYASDITYIPTQEGWLYLSVVIDLYSRKLLAGAWVHG